MTNNAAVTAQAAQSGQPAFNVKQQVEALQLKALSVAATVRQGHLATYAHIGEIRRFYLAVMADEALWAAFVKECNRLKVPLAQPQGNPFLPFVRMLDGEYLLPDGSPAPAGQVTNTWRPNRSSEKYAPVLVWLEQESVDPDDVVDTIDGYKDGDGRTKIFGIIAAVQKVRRAERGPTLVKWGKGEKERARDAETLCELPIDPSTVQFHDGFAVGVLCLVNGKVVLKKRMLRDANATVRFVKANFAEQETATDEQDTAKGYRTGNGISVDLSASHEGAAA